MPEPDLIALAIAQITEEMQQSHAAILSSFHYADKTNRGDVARDYLRVGARLMSAQITAARTLKHLQGLSENHTFTYIHRGAYIHQGRPRRLPRKGKNAKTNAANVLAGTAASNDQA